MWVKSSCPLIAPLVIAYVVIAPLLCTATPTTSKLGKLAFQRMPAGFDCGHVVDELPNLAS